MRLRNQGSDRAMRMGRGWSRAAVSALIVAACSFGQSVVPLNVNGWNRIQWGFTFADVRAVYGTQRPIDTYAQWLSLQLPSVTVDGIALAPTVSAKKGSDRISLISLGEGFGLPESEPQAGPADFETIKASLIQKYGSPAETTQGRERSMEITTLLWVFPSTSISLEMQHNKPERFGTITIRYRPIEKAKDIL